MLNMKHRTVADPWQLHMPCKTGSMAAAYVMQDWSPCLLGWQEYAQGESFDMNMPDCQSCI